jgi:outer membrane protein TolC
MKIRFTRPLVYTGVAVGAFGLSLGAGMAVAAASTGATAANHTPAISTTASSSSSTNSSSTTPTTKTPSTTHQCPNMGSRSSTGSTSTQMFVLP